MSTIRLRAGALIVLAGCALQPAPVLMQGVRAEIAGLAGTWEGTYESADSRRDGTISFTVRAGSDTADGHVMMLPAAGGQRFVAEDAANGAHAAHARSPEFLSITFVQVSDGVVEGALERYVAPDCNCVVSTVFRGTVTESGIAGQYLTLGEGGLRQTGVWRVRRR